LLQPALKRTREPKKERMRKALSNIYSIEAELCKRSFFHFVKTFWEEVSNDEFKPNWHIELLCQELTEIAKRVAENKPKKHDLIVNIPPGTTKTITCSIMFPVWCWIKWFWMRFITASYSGALSLESAEYSRDLVKSEKFKQIFPNLSIKQDKDTKSNFRIQKQLNYGHTPKLGGNRYSTSVGGTLTGFHGHILIVDDPLDPNRAFSEVELNNANRWMEQTLSTRKVDKAVSPTILIMQRLHQNDPSGHMLAKKKANTRHVSLPGEIRNYKKEVQPKELIKNYKNDLLDPNRMSWEVLKDMEADLGQYGYAGQVGQRPTPPGGGMFKVDHFQTIEKLPSPVNFVNTVRYWDKAGTQDGGAYTVGCKMAKLVNGKYVIIDIKRGQWASEERERIIRETTEADGKSVIVYLEQEGGSGGKESVDASIRNLSGYSAYADHPTGDKVFRADPYSVQVNNGNVLLLRADWNHAYVEEHRHFPFSTYKDQVDASSGAFNHLAKKKIAGPVLRSNSRV